MSLRNKNVFLIVFCLFLGILALAVGISSFAKKSRYLPVQATITQIEEEYDMVQDRFEHKTFAKYIVNGVEYEIDIGYYENSFSVGKVIEIRYDPEEPTNVEAASEGFLIYLAVIGTALFALGIYLIFRKQDDRDDIDSLRQ